MAGLKEKAKEKLKSKKTKKLRNSELTEKSKKMLKGEVKPEQVADFINKGYELFKEEEIEKEQFSKVLEISDKAKKKMKKG